MALQWLEDDGDTPAGPIALGTIAPGQSYIGKNGSPYQLVLKNVGANTWDNVAIQLVQVGSFALHQYIRVAIGDSEPSAEDYVGADDPDLEVGTLEAGESVKVWLDADVPLSAPRQMAQMVSLRAYGEEQS